jgi:prepilin signal peptidase PulO-like enzyme (type II secretory pathway)
MLFAAVLGAAFFALAAFVGVQLGNAVADTLTRFEDGPEPGHAPVRALLAGCAAIGAVTATHAAAPAQLLLIAIVCTSLVAAWCCDARTGIVPDLFTLVPLGLILAVALWMHEWWIFISTLAPLLPFAGAAMLSRGRGMGWGDVKLAALGGGVLGAQLSLLAFALACIAAVVVTRLGIRTRGPVAFGPYLAAAIGLAIPLGMLK